MAQRQHLISNELNKTAENNHSMENFHGAECYGLLGQIGFLSKEKVALLLDQGKVSDRRNRMLEALSKICYARIAGLEGNYAFAIELFDQVLAKINVLNQGPQQESALAYFYYEYSDFQQRIGDVTTSELYLDKARAYATSNKMKQMITYKTLVMESRSQQKSALKKWLQCIAYFNKYDMTVMEAQAHFDLGMFLAEENNLTDASDHLDIAHEMATLGGFQNLRWSIDYSKGCLLAEQNRDSEAIGYFTGLIKSVPSNYYRARMLLKVCELQKKLGDVNAAQAAAKTCVELCQRYSISSDLASSSVLLAEIYHRELRDITKAFFYYQQSFGSIMSLARRGVPMDHNRQSVLNDYVLFLEEHFPGETSESANEDLFSFSKEMNWVKIKDLFHYNLFLYHYMNTGVGNKTLEALDFPASSFYSATERLRSRGITFPNFRRNDVEIPSENYVEGLQQYARLHRDKSWVDINEKFEKDMLAYHYKLNNYNKKLLAKHLELAYSGIVNRTKYLTSGSNE